MRSQDSRKPSDPANTTRSDGAARQPRADARRNRERILAAARETYAARGIDVPMTAVARQAGVGPATLYRHFPTRAALVAEAFAEQVSHCVSVLDDALEDPDPWHGFCSFIEEVCAMQAVDHGFTAAFLEQFPEAVDYERERARAETALGQLVQRAQEAGKLRADFAHADVVLLLLANSGVTQDSPHASLLASRRLTAYLLQSFRAAGAETTDGRPRPLPPPAPLGLNQVHRSTRDFGG